MIVIPQWMYDVARERFGDFDPAERGLSVYNPERDEMLARINERAKETVR